jgi:2-methylisocitrate lyase-like PEP mutase family enzyme
MTLRQQLSDGPIVVAPGIYDALGASLAQQAGFRTLYLSGASIAYTRFGRPDIGLVGMSEVAETLSVIRERVELPVVVDADTGFGNALNVQRTVALFERSGASAIQIEDQTLPKRCGHLTGKTLVSTGEMVGKVKAACDARRSAETLIVARTDAIAVEGLSQALDRARAYVEAGADIAFVEAPRSLEEMKQVVATLGGRVPLIANMVEGGSTPALDAAALQALGFKLAIFPGGLVRAIGRLMQDYFASLQRHGSTEPFRNNMLDFVGLNEVLGTAEMLERGKRYDESARVAPINRKGAAE